MKITKKNIRLVVGVVLITLLIVICVQNSAQITITLLPFAFRLPVFLLVLFSAALGFGAGWLFRSKR